jgi:hypothetical protein
MAGPRVDTPRKIGLSLLAVALAAFSIQLAGSRRRDSAVAAPDARLAASEERAASEPPVTRASADPVAEPGSRSAVAPTPDTGSAILGTVVGADEQPIAGARVWLFPSSIDSVPGRPRGRHVPDTSLVTGADGRFRFVSPVDSRRAVLVEAAGHVPKWRNQEPGVDVPFELEAAARLYGSVAGAQVWASACDWDGTAIDRPREATRYAETRSTRSSCFASCPTRASPSPSSCR